MGLFCCAREGKTPRELAADVVSAKLLGRFPGRFGERHRLRNVDLLNVIRAALTG